MSRPLALAILVSLAVTVTFAWIVRERADASHWCRDGAAYRFQAQTLAIGRLAAPPPPEPDAFRIALVRVRNGRWAGQYYPGFPLLLAAGVVARADWLVNPGLAGLAVLGTFLLGRRLLGEAEGLVAAILLATSPLLANMTTVYLSHVACAALLVGAAWALARALQEARPGWAVPAGFLFGWAVAARPFTAILLGVALALPLGLRLVRRERDAFRVALVFAASAAPWALVLLGWNAVATGDPFLSAYAVNHPDHGLGFHGIPPHRRFLPGEVVEAYTPRIAWLATWRQLRGLADTLFVLAPFTLLLPLAAPFVARGRFRLLGLLAVGPLLLVAGYFLYPGTLGVSAISMGPRYYSEALPALALLAALPVAALFRRGRAGAGVAVVLVAALAATAALRDLPRHADTVALFHRTSTRGPNRELERLLARTAGEKRLVFVDPATYDRASALLVNRPDLTGDTVVAMRRDPAGDRAVRRSFPGRSSWLATAAGTGELRLIGYDPGSDEPRDP